MVLAIPLAVVFINLGMYDSVYSLALMHTALALPTTVLVIGSVFASIPYELEEAAQVFGCTPLQAFRHVVLPLVTPRDCRRLRFYLCLILERGVCGQYSHRAKPHPAGPGAGNVLSQSSEPYQFAGGFFMMIPAMIFIFFIRNYLFNMWGQISK